jgi:hypothetical protein
MHVALVVDGRTADDVARRQEGTMSKLSPLQTIKRDFNSKKDLVDKLVGAVERFEDEDDAAFRSRLMSVSNKKLLRLHATSQRVASEFGTKEKLVDAIVTLKFSKSNDDFKTKLMGYRIGRLLDLHSSLAG